MVYSPRSGLWRNRILNHCTNQSQSSGQVFDDIDEVLWRRIYPTSSLENDENDVNSHQDYQPMCDKLSYSSKPSTSISIDTTISTDEDDSEDDYQDDISLHHVNSNIHRNHHHRHHQEHQPYYDDNNETKSH